MLLSGKDAQAKDKRFVSKGHLPLGQGRPCSQGRFLTRSPHRTGRLVFARPVISLGWNIMFASRRPGKTPNAPKLAAKRFPGEWPRSSEDRSSATPVQGFWVSGGGSQKLLRRRCPRRVSGRMAEAIRRWAAGEARAENGSKIGSTAAPTQKNWSKTRRRGQADMYGRLVCNCGCAVVPRSSRFNGLGAQGPSAPRTIRRHLSPPRLRFNGRLPLCPQWGARSIYIVSSVRSF